MAHQSSESRFAPGNILSENTSATISLDKRRHTLHSPDWVSIGRALDRLAVTQTEDSTAVDSVTASDAKPVEEIQSTQAS
ncbi:hypothetical protein BGZ94_005148, partial [Podila epigama]